MANFIEEFFYGNLDPQARSTKQNKAVQKQMEILMNNEEKLTAGLNDENKKLFLDFANAWSVVNGESTLDSFIMGFRLGAKFTYDTFIGTDAPFEDLRKEIFQQFSKPLQACSVILIFPKFSNISLSQLSLLRHFSADTDDTPSCPFRKSGMAYRCA